MTLYHDKWVVGHFPFEQARIFYPLAQGQFRPLATIPPNALLPLPPPLNQVAVARGSPRASHEGAQPTQHQQPTTRQMMTPPPLVRRLVPPRRHRPTSARPPRRLASYRTWGPPRTSSNFSGAAEPNIPELTPLPGSGAHGRGCYGQ